MEILYKRNKNTRNNLKKALTTVSTITAAAGSIYAYIRLTAGNRKKAKLNKISNLVKIGSASLGILSGGLRLFKYGMPAQNDYIRKRTKRTFKTLKRKLAI